MTVSKQPAPDVIIRACNREDFPSVEALWIALYRHQKDHGMLLDVSPSSFKDWAAAMTAVLGRFTCLFVAEQAGRPIGFLAGRIRSLPPYFGGFPVGFISEVFVDEAYRGKGIGRLLVAAAIEWFQTQKVWRIELQVLVGNTGARKVYRDLGWKEELVQMVWEADRT
jgi:GNAT superfamily N-acetyltransferase